MSTKGILAVVLVVAAVVCIAESTLLNSALLKKTMKGQLEQFKSDLLQAKNRPVEEGFKDAADKKRLNELVEGLEAEAEKAEHEQADAEKNSKNEEAAPDAGEKKESEDKASEEKPITSDDDDDEDEDNDDDDAVDADDVTESIYIVAAGLDDEIKEHCKIDLEAIFNGFTPATLAAANEATQALSKATQDLKDLLDKSPPFAKKLQDYLNSANYKDTDVAKEINQTIHDIDKAMTAIDIENLCAMAKLIVLRLQMVLYGGQGFANGYLCNKVFVELARYQWNATKLMKAIADDEPVAKTCALALVDDIECYEKELEFYHSVLPTSPYSASTPLQTAAFTTDFLIYYGVEMFYHRIIIELEAEIIALCASGKDDDDDDEDDDEDDEDNDVRKEQDSAKGDSEPLVDQLQRLLQKLNEVNAKKEAAAAARGKGANDAQSEAANLKRQLAAGLPSASEKIALKKPFYRDRA